MMVQNDASRTDSIGEHQLNHWHIIFGLFYSSLLYKIESYSY